MTRPYQKRKGGKNQRRERRSCNKMLRNGAQTGESDKSGEKNFEKKEELPNSLQPGGPAHAINE